MADVPLDDLGVNHQPLRHVLQRAEDDVGGQERLWQGDPPEETRDTEEGQIQEKTVTEANASGRQWRPLIYFIFYGFPKWSPYSQLLSVLFTQVLR